MSTTETRRSDTELLNDARAVLRTGGALAGVMASVVEAVEKGDMRQAVRVLAALTAMDGDPRVSILGHEIIACVNDSH